MLQGLARGLERFSVFCHAFGTLVVLPLLAVVITLNVIMRYFFNMPFIWGEEANGLMLFLVLVLSLVYTWDQQKHIRMEIVYIKLPARLRGAADILSGITGMIFFGLLFIQCLRDIPYMFRTNEASEELLIPLWPFRALLALICIVFTVRLAYYMATGRKQVQGATGAIEREGIVIDTRGR